MNPSTQNHFLQGGAGQIEALLDLPDPEHFAKPQGVAVLAHPHPLYAGSMTNKVVQTLARACVAKGFATWRFNFRGVGQSAGVYDAGMAETDDMLAVVAQGAPDAATPLVIGGFSFGSFVAGRVVAHLVEQQQTQRIHRLLLVGTATSRFEVPPIAPELHERTLVIHGEQDDTVPLAATLDWARPQSLPVTVVPAGGHFFHGQLPLLKSLALRFL